MANVDDIDLSGSEWKSWAVKGAIPNILVIHPGLIPSVIIGVLRPLLSLERKKRISLSVCTETQWTTDDINRSDIVVFCRNQSQNAYSALLCAKAAKKHVIYEIDDNFFEAPLNISIGRTLRIPRSLHTVRRMFELADITRVYTRPMVDLATNFGARVHLVRSYFDHYIIDEVPLVKSNKVVKIAFATGRSADPKLDVMLEDAVKDILDKYGSKVEFHFWRKPSKQLRDYPQVKINLIETDYNKFIKSFYQSGFDIGLAPLLKTIFYESKTNNKFREYGGCSIAGIYSDAAPYLDSVGDGVTGLIVENTREQWFEAMTKLIDNPQLREVIVENAKSIIHKNYNYKQAVQSWFDDFNYLSKTPPISTNLKASLYHRNILVDHKRWLATLNDIYPSVIGSDVKNNILYNIICLNEDTDKINNYRILQLNNTLTWVMVQEPLKVKPAFLTTIADGSFGLVVDLSKNKLEKLSSFLKSIESFDIKLVVVITSQQFVDLPLSMLPISATEKRNVLERVCHDTYPRSEHFKIPSGYVVITPSSEIPYLNVSLNSTEGLISEILDCMIAQYPTPRSQAMGLGLVSATILRSKFLSPSKKINLLNKLSQHEPTPKVIGRTAYRKFLERFYLFRWRSARWLIAQRSTKHIDIDETNELDLLL
ncbi:glycosyltransferase [Ahrensia sp. 13_GOM-1096m]|uniref:glycosyltransferase n=1 Tax=Ahrensia sp. 13_GOM-1096m TaxID=1380380 RepID=UPI00047C6C15|nr:glycosyltransferase [Ahrensia sp. 13_GOM-1096m]